MHGLTKNEKIFRPEYIDIICLVILWMVFFMALFMARGIWFIIDVLLLAGIGAVLGCTVGKMVKV